MARKSTTKAGAAKTRAKRTTVAKPSRDATKQAHKEKYIRISFIYPREAEARLDWMMKVSRQPTKVDLLRTALDRYFDDLVEEEATKTEMRKRAGAPDV